MKRTIIITAVLLGWLPLSGQAQTIAMQNLGVQLVSFQKTLDMAYAEAVTEAEERERQREAHRQSLEESGLRISAATIAGGDAESVSPEELLFASVEQKMEPEKAELVAYAEQALGLCVDEIKIVLGVEPIFSLTIRLKRPDDEAC